MSTSKEGQPVPNVTFRTRQDGQWVDQTSDDVFKNKKVVVFSLPGAFTPTCSSSHLPRYDEMVDTFKEQGVDAVVCISVNDGFVMEAWGKDQKIRKVTLLADGNGDFSEGMGMLVDKSDLGFGKRSWRYSMLVNDGVVEKVFSEPDKPGDPFEVSDADTMLNYINPKASPPIAVTIFTKPGCPFCLEAKTILQQHKLSFEEIELGGNVSYSSLKNVTGESTAPQIFIDGRHIGGTDRLKEYFSK